MHPAPNARDRRAHLVCRKALVRAGADVETISHGLLVEPRSAWRALRMAGKVQSRRGLTADLPTEEWRPLDGFRVMVSNLGRVKTESGSVLSRRWEFGRAVVWARTDAGQGTQVRVAPAVLSAFHLLPLTRRGARHLNGDPSDCRLENLVPDQLRVTEGKQRYDQPWTEDEDDLLWAAETLEQAVSTVPHTRAAVRRRMRELGIERGTVRRRKPMEERDLSTVSRAVADLEAARVGDLDINRFLGIKGVSVGPATRPSYEACIRALWEAGWTGVEISSACGWTRQTGPGWLRRLGLVARKMPVGQRTLQGPGADLPGERWLPTTEAGYFVSSEGRVMGPLGGLLTPRHHQGGALSVSLRGRIIRLSKVVVTAFRPDLLKVGWAHLSGDPDDCRLANIVAKGASTSNAAPVEAAHGHSGNIAQQTGASANARRDQLFGDSVAFVRKAMRWADAGTVDDVAMSMVVALIDGRAVTQADALKIARAETGLLVDKGRYRSLDAALGDDGSRSLHDILGDSE